MTWLREACEIQAGNVRCLVVPVRGFDVPDGEEDVDSGHVAAGKCRGLCDREVHRAVWAAAMKGPPVKDSFSVAALLPVAVTVWHELTGSVSSVVCLGLS
jgi:hypothetical protein